MRTLGNIIWFLLVGLWSAIGYIIGGILLCITLIGIPFGTQLFKLSRLVVWPFGKIINWNFARHPIANFFWLLFGGLLETLGFLIVGVVLCVTIIGIPFGKQCFKLAKLSFIPFGSKID